MSLEALPLDLVSIVDRSMLLLQALAVERGVLLSREVANDIPAELIGGALRVQQVRTGMQQTRNTPHRPYTHSIPHIPSRSSLI